MVRIRHEGKIAQFSGGKWQSGDPFLEGVCRYWTLDHPWNPSPSNPSPDLDVAQFVADKIGAEITHYDKPDYVEGRVY
jgi:hypothetical protein